MIGTGTIARHNVKMCSRFEIDVPWENIADYFGLGDPPDDYFYGEIRPTNKALIIDSGGTPRSAQWGIPAPWDGKPLINARSETLEKKQTFQPLLENRCIVPASAYFEWRKYGKKKLKNRIVLKDKSLMVFAGLLSESHFTIITCEPSSSIAHIHNRMPVILPGLAAKEWCNSSHPFKEVAPLLKPFNGDHLTVTEDMPKQADLFGSGFN
jgi:putative SOS response-associated peptidase YedK